MEAVRTAPDGQFVTVKEKDQDVSVSKVNGNIVVRVRDGEKSGQTVDRNDFRECRRRTGFRHEIRRTEPVAGAIRALSDASDALLITVQDATQHVRIWVDSRNTQD